MEDDMARFISERNKWLGHQTFKEIVVKSRKVKGLSVSLNWDCFEGNEGDFDAEDPQDEPLLRFDVSMRLGSRGLYQELQDSSFCTQLTAYDDRKLLTKAAQVILKEAEENCTVKRGVFEYHWKRIMEGLSWMGIKEGKLV
jgi:hypothetical protein